ncbi:hypothetical protein AGMMS49942_28580 [Spirochaetia bacterium]|nr:hypothetical protein AGMMS49942_28580 [Spirochaetia bacterium]
MITACEKKQSQIDSLPVVIDDNQSPAVDIVSQTVVSTTRDVTFEQAVNAYFDDDNPSLLNSLIGEVIPAEEFDVVDSKHGGSSRHLPDIKWRFSLVILGDSLKEDPSTFFTGIEKNIIYTEYPERTGEGVLCHIYDVKTFETKDEYILSVEDLWEETGTFYPTKEIRNSFGLIELEGEDWYKTFPYKTHVIPDYILTVDTSGKIDISRPTDKSKYVFITGEE